MHVLYSLYVLHVLDIAHIKLSELILMLLFGHGPSLGANRAHSRHRFGTFPLILRGWVKRECIRAINRVCTCNNIPPVINLLHNRRVGNMDNNSRGGHLCTLNCPLHFHIRITISATR